MQTYIFKFYGRQLNAIGKMSKYTETITAPSKREAILKLYESYEHILNLTIKTK
jgi:hypothetical protein